jgi:hypothetical protein
MRTVRNITVAVTPELYRQTRMLAAEYDTTVTALVAYLLQAMPKALKAARFPVGGPQSTASSRPAQSASPTPASSANPPTPSSEKIANSGCEAVSPSLNHSLSNTCEGGPHGYTAPVPQYADTNKHI